MTLRDLKVVFQPDYRFGRWWKGGHRGMHIKKVVCRGNVNFSCACIVFVTPLGYLSSCSEARLILRKDC